MLTMDQTLLMLPRKQMVWVKPGNWLNLPLENLGQKGLKENKVLLFNTNDSTKRHKLKSIIDKEIRESLQDKLLLFNIERLQSQQYMHG